MWRSEGAHGAQFPDVDRFVATINDHANFFDHDAPIMVARAPGRLDLMGGIADYSGSLVLQLPLAAATFVAAQPTNEPHLIVRTLVAASMDAAPEIRIPLAALAPSGVPLEYAAAHTLLTAEHQRRWVAYVAGVVVVLAHERKLALTQGLRLLIDSTVPPGKGVSSSAALEVAVMQAIRTVYGLDLTGREMALLCQVVENQVVGAPCGIMDQMTAACGQADELLALLCQPAELQAPVVIPPDIEVWGIDSGIRHAVTGADYGAVRVGAFMGYRILSGITKRNMTNRVDNDIQVGNSLWHGYLANIAPSLWENSYRDHLPTTINGAAFLSRYGATSDPVTQVDPDRTYAVRQPTAHPIYEHHRVQLFRALLARPSLGEAERILLGELMYQSHASYSACGLGSSGTDQLVELVRALGPRSGLYGAKITGGGSGGTVAVLARRGERGIIDALANQYERETGHKTTILCGSSPGAATFGVRQFGWH